jgi:hypothetical protein
MDAATEAKGAVETAQRELRATGVQHTTRFFELRDNRWIPRIHQYVNDFLTHLYFFWSSHQTRFTGSRMTHKRQPRQYRHGYGPGRPKAVVTHRALEQTTFSTQASRIAVVAHSHLLYFRLVTAGVNPFVYNPHL